MELRVQDAEAEALAMRLVAVEGQVTVRPVEGLTREVRLTLPTKLKILFRETEIETPETPELKLTGVPTDIVKSPTWTTALAEWDNDPEDPLIVTLYVPGDEELKLQGVVTVWFADKVTLVGQVALNPRDGLTVELRLTLPAKLL